MTRGMFFGLGSSEEAEQVEIAWAVGHSPSFNEGARRAGFCGSSNRMRARHKRRLMQLSRRPRPKAAMPRT